MITSPFSFVASANVILYERARPVFVDIDPHTLCVPADAVAAAVTERTARAAAGAHLRLGRRRAGHGAARACRSSRTRARRSGAVHADGTLVGARGHAAVFAFYANKQLTTGEGGMVVTRDAAAKGVIDSERNQGRAPDMGWLDHDRLGFNYRLTDLAVRARDRAARAPRRHARRPRPGRGGLPRGAGRRSRGSSCRADGRRLAAGSSTSSSSRAESTATTTIVALRERGVASKPYLPAIHLMSRSTASASATARASSRSREDVAARSLALPFFPADDRGPGRAGGRGAGRRPRRSPA